MHCCYPKAEEKPYRSFNMLIGLQPKKEFFYQEKKTIAVFLFFKNR